MTQDQPFDGDVTTVDEFEDALRALVVTAFQNGVDPRGAWDFRTDDGAPDWEVMVLELQARDESE